MFGERVTGRGGWVSVDKNSNKKESSSCDLIKWGGISTRHSIGSTFL